MTIDLLQLMTLYPGTVGGLMCREGGDVAYEQTLDWLHNKPELHNDGFIEIGSAWGASFHLWGSIIGGGPKISVDYIDTAYYPYLVMDEFDKRNATWSQHFTDVHAVYGDSKAPDTIQQVADILNGRQVGWLYIDGDHSFEGAQSDYNNYKQFVKPNGYIGFHDIGDVAANRHHRRDDCGGFYQTIADKEVWKTVECEGIGIVQV